MKNKFKYYHIEYLSLILVLSFFIIHNIYLEFIGIGLALLSINKKLIIGITNNKKYLNGKYKQSDALHLYYSTSAKDQKKVKYELKKYEDSDNYYLIRDVTLYILIPWYLARNYFN